MNKSGDEINTVPFKKIGLDTSDVSKLTTVKTRVLQTAKN